MDFNILFTFGIILIIGLSTGEGLRKIKAPQVVGFILAGVILGPTGVNLLSPKLVNSLTPFTSVALAIIGFNIGSELQLKKLKKLGKSIFFIVIFEAFFAFALVCIGTYVITGQLAYGLLFGSLAAATAPAATVDVLYEYEAKGTLTTTLLAVVGLDDAVALIIYAFSFSFAKVIISPTIKLSAYSLVWHPMIEIFGSLLLGAVLGFIFILIAKRIKNKIKILILTLGFILLASGLAIKLNLSLILVAMAIGMITVNISHSTTSKISGILSEFVPPIYIIFFALVGARLNLRNIVNLEAATIILIFAYVFLRATGKYLGVFVGSLISKAKATVRKYLGFALFSQAGVAIGLAIFCSNELRTIPGGQKLADITILTITMTTFLVQIIGPPFVKFAIFKAGENNKT